MSAGTERSSARRSHRRPGWLPVRWLPAVPDSDTGRRAVPPTNQGADQAAVQRVGRHGVAGSDSLHVAHRQRAEPSLQKVPCRLARPPCPTVATIAATVL
jgi:hypothetical protein